MSAIIRTARADAFGLAETKYPRERTREDNSGAIAGQRHGSRYGERPVGKHVLRGTVPRPADPRRAPGNEHPASEHDEQTTLVLAEIALQRPQESRAAFIAMAIRRSVRRAPAP